jgi:hypothetical protein
MTTFQLLGIQFGVSESTANDTFNYWMPILNELLPSSLLEQVKKKPLTMKQSKKSSQKRTICGLVRFRIGSLILPAGIPARSGGQNQRTQPDILA